MPITRIQARPSRLAWLSLIRRACIWGVTISPSRASISPLRTCWNTAPTDSRAFCRRRSVSCRLGVRLGLSRWVAKWATSSWRESFSPGGPRMRLPASAAIRRLAALRSLIWETRRISFSSPFLRRRMVRPRSSSGDSISGLATTPRPKRPLRILFKASSISTL